MVVFKQWEFGWLWWWSESKKLGSRLLLAGFGLTMGEVCFEDDLVVVGFLGFS